MPNTRVIHTAEIAGTEVEYHVPADMTDAEVFAASRRFLAGFAEEAKVKEMER